MRFMPELTNSKAVVTSRGRLRTGWVLPDSSVCSCSLTAERDRWLRAMLSNGLSAMFTLALFGISVLFSLIAWTILARQFIWPVLRDRTRADALRPILMLHSFRFVGLSFLIPGVVSPNLPWSFAGPAAYGDLATAILALLALATLRTSTGTGSGLGI